MNNEPVAWMYQEYKRVFMHFDWFDEVQFVQPPNDPEKFRNITPLYTTPQPASEDARDAASLYLNTNAHLEALLATARHYVTNLPDHTEFFGRSIKDALLPMLTPNSPTKGGA